MLSGDRLENVPGSNGRGEAVWKDAVIPWSSKQIVLHSAAEELAYRIYAAVPPEEPPAAGFPVMYVLDANSVFGTVVEAVRAQTRIRERTGLQPAVIVGIGYETDAPFSTQRHYDFTSSVPLEELPPHPQGGEWPRQGGADAFLDFLENEVKPLVQANFAVNLDRQTLFGHSLGGLFVLHALFAKPEAFGTYIAGSPSIYWNGKVMADKEARFSSRVQQEGVQAKVLLAAGELERTHHSSVNALSFELVRRLQALECSGLQAEYAEFPGENHISVLPALISRAVRFAFPS